MLYDHINWQAQQGTMEQCCFMGLPSGHIQGGPKKLSYHTLSISSHNIDQFSQFFSPVDSVRNSRCGVHASE